MDFLDKSIKVLKQIQKLNTIPCNYGELTHKNSIDLCLNGTLAICTKNNIILYSLNLQSDEKSFNLKQKSTQLSCFNVKIIEKSPISQTFKSILMKYYELNTRTSKRKQSQLKADVTSLKKPRLSVAKSEELSADDEDLVCNGDSYQETLIQSQQRLFSSIFVQQLSKLNPFNPQQQCQSNVELNGFRYCKWNTCLDTILLATISLDNQIVVYYFDEISNSFNYSRDKCFNITDVWMEANVSSLLVSKNVDLVDTLCNLVPVSLCWSENFQMLNQQSLNFLFVSFKSNQIGIFYCCKSDCVLNGFKWSTTLCLNDQLNSSTKGCIIDLSCLNTFKIHVVSMTCSKINDNSFILAFGLYNGNVLIKTFEISNDFSLIERKTLKMSHSNPSKKILIEFFNDSSTFLLCVCQWNFQINFNLFDLTSDEIKDSINSKHHASSSIINVILMDRSNLIFLICYENGQNELIKLTINSNHKLELFQDLSKYSMKFYENNSNFVYQQLTKQVLLTKNQTLLLRVFTTPKATIVNKKPFNFVIEYYSISDSLDNFSKIFLSCDCLNAKSLKTYSDCFWLFKRCIHQNERNANKIISTSISKEITSRGAQKNMEIVRRWRLIMILLYNYFKMKEKSTSEIGEDESKFTGDGVITSPAYYKSVSIELSLSIAKQRLIHLVEYAYKCGFQNLNQLEKHILVVQADFLLKKKFIDNKNLVEWLDYCFKQKSNSSLKYLWSTRSLDENSYEVTRETHSLEEYMKCQLCDEAFDMRKNYELCYFECELGHKIHRCEKTLLPLNFKKYKKCLLCSCVWNIYERKDDLPNFCSSFFDKFNFCLYCD